MSEPHSETGEGPAKKTEDDQGRQLACKLRKVLLTGAAGFLGKNIAGKFIEAGYEVAGIDLAEKKPKGFTEYEQMELPSEKLCGFLQRFEPDVCVHCAGSASVGSSISDPASDFRSSVIVTEQLLAALRKAVPRCRTIFLSSAAVYGQPDQLPVGEESRMRPLSPYGYHKRVCELLCEKAASLDGIPTASVRIFSAYGPGLRRQVLWEMAAQLAAGKRLQLKGIGDETRDFIHASDVASAVRIVAEKAPAAGEAYNVATGNETSIREVAEMLCAHFPGSQPPLFAGRRIEGDPQRWRADCSRIGDLGFSTTVSLEEGLASLARWAKEQTAAKS